MPSSHRRHIPPWLTHIAVICSIVVIGVMVLFGVANSAPGSKPAADATTIAFTANSAYIQTYAAHCAGGQPFIVKPDDTLQSIAARFGVPVDELAKTNGLNPNAPLVPGEVLCPPVDNANEPILVGTTSLEPCQSHDYWLPHITQWAVPPGCYGLIYTPNPADYPYRPTWGWCNWWPEEEHPNLPGDEALHLPKHRTPIVGATVWFDPFEQGAGSEGHYAELVAINPDGYWLLISEMNDSWRGAGWGKIDYRYIHVSPGVWFMY